MERVEIEGIVAPVLEIFQKGDLRGAAYFNDLVGDNSVTFGTLGLSESEVGIAVFRIIQAAGCSVERICLAVMLLDKSEQQRN